MGTARVMRVIGRGPYGTRVVTSTPRKGGGVGASRTGSDWTLQGGSGQRPNPSNVLFARKAFVGIAEGVFRLTRADDPACFERPQTPRNPPFQLPAPPKKKAHKPSALWRCARLLRLLPLVGQQGTKLAVLFSPLLLGLIQPLPQVLDLVR
jgi:hypothetical protein